MKIEICRAVLKHCKSLKQVHQLHAHSLVSGLLASPKCDFLINSFLHTFVSFLPSSATFKTSLLLGYGVSLFNLIQNPSTFSFNTIVRAHSLLSSPFSALLLFIHMRRLSLPPDFHTFPFALKACSQLRFCALSLALSIHSQVLKFGFDSDSFVTNGLIRVYSVFHSVRDACQVFDESTNRDVVSYNTLIDGFVKAGDISRARQLFDEMPIRDSVTWGTIISGYAQTNHCEETIELFHEMLALGLKPDNIALVAALSACARLGDLDRGGVVHDHIRRNGLRIDSFLATGLVDLYAKCGFIERAREIFDSGLDKNLFTWNAMLVGFAIHGQGQLCLDYFSRMIEAGVVPDGVTFLGVLVGCSHSGLVLEARKLFEEMESVYRVLREIKHYGCMADLLARAGLIEEVMEMIREMPNGDDVFVWAGLLGGCRLHGNVEMAKRAAEHVMELKPEDGGVYSIMANVYANVEQWDDVVKVRRSMDSNNEIVKKAGWSLIGVDGVRYEFVSGDRLHPQTHDIYFALNGLERHQFEAL
ncbi:hypothetical protein UlMin_027905 [Ulmus minor]